MRKLLGLLLLLLPVIATAQSGVDGTWKLDLNKAQMDAKPEIYELKDGMFTCATCDPKVMIKADGTDQKLAGSPAIDTERVTIVSGNTVERIGMKDGKIRFRDTLTVSPDGKTMTRSYEGHPSASEQPMTATGVYSRVGDPETGAHALSGSWKTEKWESASDNALTFKYSMSADGLNYKASTGESYSAKFDGQDYPFQGDPGTTEVSLKKIDDHTFQETYKRKGEVVGTSQIMIAPDGKSMTIISTDTHRGTKDTWVADRQGSSSDAMADK